MFSRIRVLGALFAGLLLTLVSIVAAAGSASADPSDPGPTVPYSTSSAPTSSTTTPSGSGVSGVGTHGSTPSSSSSGVAGVCETKVSSTNGTATIDCSGFEPDTPICEGLDSSGSDLGSGTTDSSGGFGDTVTLPSGTSGAHKIYVGPCSGGAGVDAVNVQVAGSSTGGTAITGVAVASIGALGLVLLVGGGVLLFAGRRRGSHTGA